MLSYPSRSIHLNIFIRATLIFCSNFPSTNKQITNPITWSPPSKPTFYLVYLMFSYQVKLCWPLSYDLHIPYNYLSSTIMIVINKNSYETYVRL